MQSHLIWLMMASHGGKHRKESKWKRWLGRMKGAASRQWSIALAAALGLFTGFGEVGLAA